MTRTSVMVPVDPDPMPAKRHMESKLKVTAPVELLSWIFPWEYSILQPYSPLRDLSPVVSFFSHIKDGQEKW